MSDSSGAQHPGNLPFQSAPMNADEPQWYVQKGARVQGPFSSHEVSRFLLLGRVRSSDRVSRDGELWEPVTQVPELIPEELLDLDNDLGWERFLQRRSDIDERTIRPGTERASADLQMAEQLRRDWSRHALGSSVLPWSLFGLTLAALTAVLVMQGGVVPLHP